LVFPSLPLSSLPLLLSLSLPSPSLPLIHPHRDVHDKSEDFF
jgi:hypothetical protein